MNLDKYWYTAKEACQLKGVSYHTLRKKDDNGMSRRYLLPNGGRGTQVLSFGRYREMYSRDQVAEWLPKTQQEIEDELWQSYRSKASTHTKSSNAVAS